MRRCQAGDRVQVHYVLRFQDGTVRSSRTAGVPPLEVTVGTDHRLLPGLGQGLFGLTEGQVVALDVPAERAYGLRDPDRIKRVTRARFADGDVVPGRRARMRLSQGRSRTVRIVEAIGGVVVVDLNHPRCGQSVRLEVELVAITETAPDHGGA
jgi:FKBP-type peptidyl-prolyl cis-trans isomerase 2